MNNPDLKLNLVPGQKEKKRKTETDLKAKVAGYELAFDGDQLKLPRPDFESLLWLLLIEIRCVFKLFL